MADKPKLTLVDAALEEVGPTPGVQPTAVKALLNRYAGAIAKRAKADERQAILTKIGQATIEEISALPALRASFEREEAKHVRGAKREGMVLGLVAGLILTSLVFVLVVRQMTDMAYEQAQRATQQGALVGAAAANQDPRSRERSVPYIHSPREPADAPQ